MKLYDMEKDEWRKFKRNECWRSKAVYQCSVCHTKLNEWFMGGWPGMGARIVCPGTGYEEHDKLIALLKEHQKLKKKITDYGKVSGSDQENKLIQALLTEEGLLKKRIREYRKLFSGKLDDVQGVGRKAEVEYFYPYAEYADKKRLKR